MKQSRYLNPSEETGTGCPATSKYGRTPPKKHGGVGRQQQQQQFVTKLKKQQAVFSKQSTLRDNATESSFIVIHFLMVSEVVFGRMCKRPIIIVSLSRRDMARRRDVICDELTEPLNPMSKKFVWFSFALDESTSNQYTAQLLIFVPGIDNNFVITKELFGLDRSKIQPLVRICLNVSWNVWRKMHYHGMGWHALHRLSRTEQGVLSSTIYIPG